MGQWNMEFTTKNGKSEMRQIMWDEPKWKNGMNYPGRRDYLLLYCNVLHFIRKTYHLLYSKMCQINQHTHVITNI